MKDMDMLSKIGISGITVYVFLCDDAYFTTIDPLKLHVILNADPIFHYWNKKFVMFEIGNLEDSYLR